MHYDDKKNTSASCFSQISFGNCNPSTRTSSDGLKEVQISIFDKKTDDDEKKDEKGD